MPTGLKLEVFLECIHSITHLPIAWFDAKGELYTQFPELPKEYNPVLAYIERLRSIDKTDRTIGYISTEEHHYYGVVKKNKNPVMYVVIGPTLCTLGALQNIGRMMYDANIKKDYEKEFNKFIQSVPYLPILSFINMLMLFYREVNHCEISRDEIRQIAGADVNIMDQIIAESFDENYKKPRKEDLCSYYRYEDTLSKIIESGDIRAIKQDYPKMPFPSLGKIANTEHRQANDVFIIQTSMAARAAIRGGLSVKTAMELCNRYIYESEQCVSLNAIESLYSPMLNDFTALVAAQKIPSALSTNIYRCVQFVRENVQRPIAIDDVAAFCGKSRSLISKKFKKEMGINLNQYIMDCKLEAAKNFLVHSDKSISYISTTFYFSSQCYFQHLFKKKYGMTPLTFRQMNRNYRYLK